MPSQWVKRVGRLWRDRVGEGKSAYKVWRDRFMARQIQLGLRICPALLPQLYLAGAELSVVASTLLPRLVSSPHHR